MESYDNLIQEMLEQQTDEPGPNLLRHFKSVIFINVDGVLNTAGTHPLGHMDLAASLRHPHPHLDASLVTNLAALIRYTQACVIISSAWRNILTHDEFEQLLINQCQSWPKGRVLGATRSQGMAERGYEVDDFVRRHALSHYLILDHHGTEHYLHHQHGHLLQTDPNCGFDETQLKQACQRLLVD